MRRTRIATMTALMMALGAIVTHAQDRTDGWVVLSLDEYRTLRARAFPAPPDPAPPPVDTALTRVDYDLRATNDIVGGEARLTVDVLKQGWVSVQAPAGVLVRGARLDGRPIALVAGNPPRVLISRAGRSTLTLDIVVPIASTSGTESMSLPASGSAVSSVRLTIPRTSVELTSSGGIVTAQSETASETTWSVYGTAGRSISFTWKRKSEDRRASMPLLVRARITSLVVLGEDGGQITASVRATVVQGAAREIVLMIPDGVTINQVSGATVAEWNQQSSTLTVSFLEPMTTEASVVITAEARTPRDGSVAIPLIRVPSAERETGGVAVDVAGAGEIGDRAPRGLDPADASELGDVVSGRESPSMAAFKFRSGAGDAVRSLSVDVSRYTPKAVLVANVEEARYEALIGEDGKTLVRARYAVRNNQRSFLAVTLPPDAVLWSASLGGRAVRPGVAPSGGLLLPLQRARPGEMPPIVSVEIVYFQRLPEWADKGTGRLTLAAVDLPVSRTGLTVRHSPRYSLEIKPGTFRADADAGPWTATLRIDESESAGVVPQSPPQPAGTPVPAAEAPLGDVAASKGAIDRFRAESGRSIAGVLPVDVRVPEFGAAIFAAAELTEESHPPSLDFNYKRTTRR
jgi:hypothetical protein